MRQSIRGVRIAPRAPGIADDPVDDVEFTPLQHFALADARPTDDHRDDATIARRGTNRLETGFEFRAGEVSD
jgi:hypothetical protein